MTDEEKREKVIRGLECCAKGSLSNCEECPYTGMGCSDHLCADALDLLKGQEAVKPIGGYGFYFCGRCKNSFNSVSQKFCSECGRKVKWDD